MAPAPLPSAAGEPCPRPRCHGTTSDWAIVHPVRHGDQTVIVEGVPARVCFTCGATRISEATQARLDALLEARPVDGTIPFREWSD
jgi:YgiT-type zinc finger domain-containing protein